MCRYIQTKFEKQVFMVHEKIKRNEAGELDTNLPNVLQGNKTNI